MNILITGSTGLLGQALARYLSGTPGATGLSRHPAAASTIPHVACDLADAARTKQVLQSLQPELVYHLQALSNVDVCEQQPQEAQAQNVSSTEHLVQALQGSGARLIAISTDYVFDGTKGAPYLEDDSPRPLSVYGRSKLESEARVLDYPQGIVVRTSTLFGAGRPTFCDQVIADLTAGRRVEAFADQVTSPTLTDDLVQGLLALARSHVESPGKQLPRLYHLANAGGCSRVAWAQRIAELVGAQANLIMPIPMAQQCRPAARPANSSLASACAPPDVLRLMRPWEQALEAYIRRVTNTP